MVVKWATKLAKTCLTYYAFTHCGLPAKIEIALAILTLIIADVLATVELVRFQFKFAPPNSDADNDARETQHFLREIWRTVTLASALSAAIQILLIIFAILTTLITVCLQPHWWRRYFACSWA